MIKGIVFDYNGVITNADWYWSLLEEKVPDLASRHKEFSSLSDRVDLGHMTSDEFKNIVAERLGMSREELNTFRGAIRTSSSYIRADLIKLIHKLRKNDYSIGLVSNYSGKSLRPQITEHNLEELFDTMVISSEVGLVKPQPEIFMYVLQELGDYEPNEIIFADDREDHVAAASAIGINAHHFIDVPSFEQYLREHDVNTL